MAHELEIREGKADMAWAGETPWHGLGTKVDPDLTPYQMLKAANLDWKVNKIPLYGFYKTKDGEVRIVEVPGKQALVRSRDDKVLSVISDDWEPVQNYDAFKFFNEFVFTGDMEMNTAGSLREGRLVWALAKVKESFTLFNGKDKIESYLLFSNPHEYGRSIDVRFTPIRVVCNNTLTLSLSMKADTMVRLNHRKKFDAEAVKRMLGIASKKLGTYKQVAELLASKKFTDAKVNEYFNAVFPKGKKQEEGEELKLSRPARVAYSILETQPGNELGAGTWWQAFNAVTFATDHLLGHSNETRLNSAWYGGNRVRKVTALEKAVEFAKA